jgi:hypothetical protein
MKRPVVVSAEAKPSEERWHGWRPLREPVPRVGTVIPFRDSHSQCRQMNNE